MAYTITGGVNNGQTVLDDSWFRGQSKLSPDDLAAWQKMGGSNIASQVNGDWWAPTGSIANIQNVLRPQAVSALTESPAPNGSPTGSPMQITHGTGDGIAPGSLAGATGSPTLSVRGGTAPTYGTPSSTPPLSPTYAPTSPGAFTGTPPKPTPYAPFAGLDPATFTHSPDYQYLQDTAEKALQRGAAARGTLLTGGFQKELQKNAAGIAAADYGAQFGRDLDTYTANRATNAQNFGQAMDAYTGSLARFNANTNVALGYDRAAADAAYGNYDRAKAAVDDQYARQQQAQAAARAESQRMQDEYAAQVEAARRAAAQPPQQPTGSLAIAKTPTPWYPNRILR